MSRPLKNTRHERFAQELAKGKSQVQAYEAAGYRPSRSAAARLAADVDICERVSNLAERVAVRTEITVAGLTERLLNIAQRGEGKDEAPLLSVARAAIMDAAKLNGMIVDKTEQRLADDQLLAVIGALRGDPDAARRLLDELEA